MMAVIVKSSEHTAARMDFSGLAVIVTGSTGGIGLGIARVFADMGIDVYTEAAAWITGTALPVDGGWTAQ